MECVRDQHSRVLERLRILRKHNHLSFITILESFSNSVLVQSSKVQLNMENASSNGTGKIGFSRALILVVIFLMKMNNKSVVKCNIMNYNTNLLVLLCRENAKITLKDLFGIKCYCKPQ